MKIKDFLCEEAVTADLKSTEKKDVIQELVDLLVKAGAVEKKIRSKLIEVLLAREALGSTAIGQGIAIPHGKCEHVTELTAALGVSKAGVDFDSLDGEPAHIFFLLVAPIDSAGPHLKALARISRLLKDKYFRDSLQSAQDAKGILALLQQEPE
ncbi:MAG TPA: PTS sugar transporter subunit IIA [Candidatus Omnitrophota bacterium]|jgi:PTS system nitrogen regulatory IIA component|nr:PTS sugar transporter subunit IIA [Candidatus Omnitrophota bacterium]